MAFLNNYEKLNVDYCQAPTWKRFVNYFIDLIIIYLFMLAATIIIEMFKPGIISGRDELTQRLSFLLFYSMIMFAIETIFKGKTIGKLITGTKAINPDGSEINIQKAFIRNIVRAIPFSAISALGRPCMPWHDRWSDTIVIEEKKLVLQQQKIDLLQSLKNRTQ
jgi:uncharacterized RDD family membrane protein YckC